jgi:hypothetical protein
MREPVKAWKYGVAIKDLLEKVASRSPSNTEDDGLIALLAQKIRSFPHQIWWHIVWERGYMDAEQMTRDHCQKKIDEYRGKIACLQQALAGYRKCLAKRKWHSILDRQPKPGVLVLVCGADWHDISAMAPDGGFPCCVGVPTHWQKLPEVPRA